MYGIKHKKHICLRPSSSLLSICLSIFRNTVGYIYSTSYSHFSLTMCPKIGNVRVFKPFCECQPSYYCLHGLCQKQPQGISNIKQVSHVICTIFFIKKQPLIFLLYQHMLIKCLKMKHMKEKIIFHLFKILVIYDLR